MYSSLPTQGIGQRVSTAQLCPIVGWGEVQQFMSFLGSFHSQSLTDADKIYREQEEYTILPSLTNENSASAPINH